MIKCKNCKNKLKQIDWLENYKNYFYCDKIYNGVDFDGIEINDAIIVNENFGCIYFEEEDLKCIK